MKTMLLLCITCMTVFACTYSDINFEAMSETELAEYNNGKNLAQMIVCSEESRAFSRVKRRRCATVEQMYGSAENAAKLGVLNTPASFGSAGGTF